MKKNYYIYLSAPSLTQTENTIKIASSDGEFLGNLVKGGDGGLFGPDGLVLIDGELYVGTVVGANILKYNAYTGKFIKEVVSREKFLSSAQNDFPPDQIAPIGNIKFGELGTATGMTVGPDGNLYVSNFESKTGIAAFGAPIIYFDVQDSILVFDTQGNHIKTIEIPIDGTTPLPGVEGTMYPDPNGIPDISDFLNSGQIPQAALPIGTKFGPDGKLYISARLHDKVYRYDPQTDQVSTFIEKGVGGLDGPSDFLFKDNLVYVTSLDSDQILVYDNNGNFVKVFGDYNGTALDGPTGIDLTPDGKSIIVTGYNSVSTVQLNSQTGEIEKVLTGPVSFDQNGNLIPETIEQGLTWGFLRNDGILVVTPEEIGGSFPPQSLYVSNVNNTSGVGPVVNITLDKNNNIASVSPNFQSGVYYSSILEYHGLTGEFLGDFVPKGNANQDGIFLSSGITFKDGFLYANDQGYQVDPTVTNPADSRYGRILKFDATTGTLLGEFISGKKLTENGLNFPEDLLFGPDGNLYVSGLGGGGVQIFDGATGEYIKTISEINPFTGSDLIVAGLNFGPDGNLYMSSVLNDNSILSYNLGTGTIDQFIPSEFAPPIPSGSVFTPDGSLFLNATFVSVDGSPIGVNQYNGQNGEPLGYFVDPSNNGGLNSVSRMRFSDQGDLYVSDFAGSQIVRFDGQGNPIDGGVFVASGVGGLNNPGGIGFYTASAQIEPDTSPVYRLWNPTIGDHFYTTNSQEAMKAVSHYNYETYYAGFFSPKADGLAVYRGWNPSIGDHFYTTNLDELNKAVNDFGYINEGIGFYAVSNPSLGEEVYRGWNPTIGDHFYTTNLDEFNKAVNNFGYINEGVAFYAYV